jgi:glycosyltransferase involved in cell wall biosynthesis
MLGFYRNLLGLERAQAQALRELGRAVPEAELTAWNDDNARMETLFLGELAAVAEPLIVHSAPTARLIADLYGKKATYLPFAPQFAPGAVRSPDERAELRALLGIGKDEVVVATFGFVGADKDPWRVVRALAALRARGIPACLHFVGELRVPRAELLALAAELGVTAHLRLFDAYVEAATFHDYLQAADLGVQLRTHDFGSISGALVDCVTAGLPTVANRGLAAAIDAPGLVEIVPDDPDPERIVDAWLTLLDGEDREKATRELRRVRFLAERNFARYADRLCAALGLVPHVEVGRDEAYRSGATESWSD